MASTVFSFSFLDCYHGKDGVDDNDHHSHRQHRHHDDYCLVSCSTEGRSLARWTMTGAASRPGIRYGVIGLKITFSDDEWAKAGMGFLIHDHVHGDIHHQKNTSMDTTCDNVSHIEGVQMQLCLSGERSTYMAGTIPKRPWIHGIGQL